MLVGLPARYELAPFMAMPSKRCDPTGDDWVRADRRWGRELRMRDAVLHSRAWRKLFRRRPLPEARSTDGFDRYDLLSVADRSVAEFKLAATTATLVQLDRYLDYLRETQGGRWTGHVVWGNSCSRVARELIAARDDVRVWRCERLGPESPRLVEE